MSARAAAALFTMVPAVVFSGTGVAFAQGKAETPPASSAAAGHDFLATSEGGLTAAQAGERAATSSYRVEASLRLAEASARRASQARAAFIPRVNVLGKYTRLSEFTPDPIIALPGANLVVTPAPGGTLNPTPTAAVPLPNTAFPNIVDQYVLDATVLIPISDYFLRIGPAYQAATDSEDAAQQDARAARARARADGELAYFAWARARAGFVVAQQTLAVARAHQRDAEVGSTIGATSKVDVLRAKSAVGAGEVLLARAQSAVSLSERQLRLTIHAPASEKLAPGETFDGPLDPPGNLATLIALARSRRPELHSLAANGAAARELARVSRAGYVPTVGAFGDGLYANPNPRRIPPEAEWFPTWAAGVQVSWGLTDIPSAIAAAGEAEARAEALDAQRKELSDGTELEAIQAYDSIVEADTSARASARELESAEEAYRAAKELYTAGRGTSTALFEAEQALAVARFDWVNARCDARAARVRLVYATGGNLDAAAGDKR